MKRKAPRRARTAQSAGGSRRRHGCAASVEQPQSRKKAASSRAYRGPRPASCAASSAATVLVVKREPALDPALAAGHADALLAVGARPTPGLRVRARAGGAVPVLDDAAALLERARACAPESATISRSSKPIRAEDRAQVRRRGWDGRCRTARASGSSPSAGQRSASRRPYFTGILAPPMRSIAVADASWMTSAQLSAAAPR